MMTFTARRILLTAAVMLAVTLATSQVASAQGDAKKGQEVYAAQKCQICHGIAGKGSKTNPLDGVGAKLSAEEIRNWIVDPVAMTAKTKSAKKPPMPIRSFQPPSSTRWSPTCKASNNISDRGRL